MNESVAPRAGPHVVVLTTSYPRGSGDFAGHFVAEEAEELARQGATVSVLSAGAPQGSAVRAAPSGLSVRYLGGACLFDHPGALERLRESPLRIRGILGPSLRLLRLGRTRELGPVDRIDAHWLLPCGYPWSLTLGNKDTLRNVIVHGSDARLFRRLPRFKRALILTSLSEFNTTLRFVSQELKEDLRDAAPTARLKTFVDRGFVRPAPLPPPPSLSRAEARAALGFSPQGRIAVIASRLIGDKRLDVALSAASLVPDLAVLVLGDGPLREPLSQEFPAVRFLGRVPHEQALLFIRASDLVLSASEHEGSPTVVREALRCGTAVVTKPCGDLALWARDETDLFLVGQRGS